jgi:hypothetical protein
MEALFPERAIATHVPRQRRPFDAMSILACCADEVHLASIAADNLSHGIELTDIDRARLRLASIRLSRAAEAANG